MLTPGKAGFTCAVPEPLAFPGMSHTRPCMGVAACGHSAPATGSHPRCRFATCSHDMPAGRATLVIMLNSRRYSLRLVDYRLMVHDWAVRLRYWWLLLEKDKLVRRSMFGLAPLAIVAAIWVSVDSLPVIMENRPAALDAQRRDGEIHCLALNVYHEARGEPKAGQYAVAEVTMNRVASRRFPDTVCEVVYEKRWDRIRKRHVGAFSWTELEAVSTSDEKAWKRAMEVAEDAYYAKAAQRMSGALFYHARHIRPSWARKKVRIARVGRHIFYK